MMRFPGWSFCVITDGQEPVKLARLIDSVRQQSLVYYELVIGGKVPPGMDLRNCRVVQLEQAAEEGRLGRMRNAVCRLSDYDHLVVLDDDIWLHGDFMEGLERFGEDWDVLSCRIFNPDGSRFWDWKTYREGVNQLLPYDQSSEAVSLTGGLTIMKAWVHEMVQWDDELGFYQAEDVDFSQRLKAAGVRIGFNPFSTVTHAAPYTQKGDVVIRK